jgi:hypothetical protein
MELITKALCVYTFRNKFENTFIGFGNLKNLF